jgi:Na+-translocating ferredoxin:NAD+ oxidoreductase subunit B
MEEDVYRQLRTFLDKMPAGFPETPTGVEIKILEKLFTPDQAELVMKLKNEPEPVPDIAARIGMDGAELAGALEDMALKGLIFRVRKAGQPLYQAFQFLVGIYEFQVNRMDAEFCRLFEEYLPYLMMAVPTLISGQLRVIPIEAALSRNSSIAPYNHVREMIKGEKLIGVTECICRQGQGLLGNECRKPKEVCMMFGDFARFYIDNKDARQITEKEVEDILKMAEENGLVLNISNSRRPEFLCCCCSCCCPTLRGIKPFPKPTDFITTYYQAGIDPQQCSGCGECIAVCPLDAISEQGDVLIVKGERCIGCGLCAGRCNMSAITMVKREDMQKAPPETMVQAIQQIAMNRGL